MCLKFHESQSKSKSGQNDGVHKAMPHNSPPFSRADITQYYVKSTRQGDEDD